MSNAPVSAASQPMQRRPSSVREGSPMPSMVGDSLSASSGGRDVTPTSPSNASSLVSIRPLPPPSLYQPPAPSALERKNSVSSVSTRGSFSTPNMPSTSPSPVMGEAPAPAATSSPKGSVVGKGKENTGRWQAEEHEIFLKGLNEHGKQWKKIAMMIKTRSVVQVRTHAQKYFQKLLKNEKKEEGRQGKERSSSILSTSTAVSTSTASTAVKRKSSTKGNKTTIAGPAAFKKRRVSLEPKKQPYHSMDASMHHVHYQAPPHLMASAPTMPVSSGPVMTQNNPGEHTIDPSFMNTLNMAEGELDDSLLELLDDSSVEAVEQVIGNDDDIDLDVDVEPTPVSPSASSASLTDTSAVEPTPTAEVMHHNRHDMVSSPQPEDFSIHNTIGTSSVSGRELSPTSVACMMDIKDFEQKTSSYVDALDWLMDVGVHQLPATAGENEEDWSNGQTSILPPAPKISHSRLAQVNSSALSVLEDDVF